MYLVIDADSLVYAAAHTAERNIYCVVLPDGTTLSKLDYDQAKAKVKEAGGGDIYKRTVVKPLIDAVGALRGMLARTKQEVADQFGAQPKTRILLTGYGNFRERVASVIRYKFNRVETQKPKHYGALRKYLVDELGADIINWYEADDEAAILQTQYPADIVVSSIDKDLLQVPGLHHIPGKGFMRVTPRAALLRLYAQILSGDPTDGIPGCWRVGGEGAKKLILETAAAVPDGKKLERQLWAVVLEQYRKSLAKHGAEKCGYSDAEDAAIETAQLVHLLRKRPADPAWPTLWSPPR